MTSDPSSEQNQGGSDREKPASSPDAVARHMHLAWWALCFFAAGGIVLEGLLGFKVRAISDVDNETRRVMWRLAHAHGTTLSLVNILFCVVARQLSGWTNVAFASRCLLAALLLIPGGFFLGGVVIYGGDPSLGIILVPAGGLLLLAGLASTARAAGKHYR